MQSGSVRTIERAVAILKALSLNLNTISETSREINLSKSTTHRLLKGLERSGLVIQDPFNYRYYLGHLLLNIASDPITAHQHLIYCAHDKMEYLRKISEESVTLHIRLAIQRLRLHELTGTHDVRYIGRPTVSDPLWAGAIGKVLLTQIQEEELALILDNIQLLPLTQHTITDKRAFKKEIDKAKKQGYATSYSETVAGVSAISVPVRGYVEPVALSIVGPEYRFASHMLDFLSELKKNSSAISRDFHKARNEPDNI